MKIFERDGKVNFVDDNNVFVGFDYEKHCCENFGWCLTREFPEKLQEGENGIDPAGFQFDTAYFEQRFPMTDWEVSSETILKNESERDLYEYGGAAIFRLTKDKEEIFLLLWNDHNGFYAHGFEMKSGDEKLRGDWL